MKKLFYLSAFVWLSLLFSCKNTNSTEKESSKAVMQEGKKELKTDSIDYAGTYKMDSEGGCDITITITKKGSEYAYLIKSFGVDYNGKLSFEKQSGDTYLVFDGKIEDNKAKAVSGLFSSNTITIQNQGNSMNEFNLFKKCDSKYLEFKK